MPINIGKHLYVFIFALFSVIKGFSQIYNTEVEAKIEIEKNHEYIKISATGQNKTAISQSLRYVFSVIRTNPENGNRSKNDQAGRFVLQPAEKQNLSTTAINSDEIDKIIILLLIYDVNDNIKGKDRIVFNDDGKDWDPEEPREVTVSGNNNETQMNASPDVDNRNKDGVVLRGIVTEDTKTKPGRDFYAMFYSNYTLNRINADQIVVIKEILALGTNTKIQVIVGDTVIFEFFAQPKNEYLRVMSEEAIRRVAYYLEYLKRQKEIVRHY